MTAPRQGWSRILHDAFEIGIAAKALFALAETLTGIGLWLLNADWVRSIASWLTASELNEDPTDWLSLKIMAAAGRFSVETQHFWTAYLLGHGLLKLVAVAALYAGVRWAYPLSVAVLAGFIVWQMQKWAATHSLLMLGLSLFDLVMILLIWHEYRNLPRRR